MGGTIRLGKILGIPIEVSYSWFIILGLVTFLLSNQFGHNNPSWSTAEQWVIGGVTTLLFFVSVLIHELSHSVLAINRGIPVKGITLFIFGGISQIAREAHRPFIEFIIAGVGPLSSFILGGFFYGIYFVVHDVSSHLGAMTLTLAFINVSLGVFNMLPGFPLDGGRVLRSIIWGVTGNYWRATLLATRAGQLLAFVMIGGGLVMVFFGQFQGIWLAAVGWFLAMAASSSLRQSRIRQGLQGFTVRDLMVTDYPTIPPGITLETLATEHILRSRQELYFVTQGERCLGMITFKAISRVPRQQWSSTTVAEAMRPLAEIPSISPHAEAVQALELIEEHSSPVVLVMDGDKLLGFVTQQGALIALTALRRGASGGDSWTAQA